MSVLLQGGRFAYRAASRRLTIKKKRLKRYKEHGQIRAKSEHTLQTREHVIQRTTTGNVETLTVTATQQEVPVKY